MTPLRERAARALIEGDTGAVVRLFDEAAPSDDAEYAAWCVLLLQAGESELARALVPRITDTEQRARIEGVLAPEHVAPRSDADDEEDALDALELRRQSGPADADVVRAFLRWFGGRTDLYAVQWHDEKRRRGGYRPVREPFTLDVARAHLAGRKTVGQYLLWPDDTVSFAVLDLDLSASARAELEAAYGSDGALRHRALRTYAERLVASGERLGLPLFPEDSGSRGAHLWLFLSPRRPARAARALLGRIVETAGAPPADVAVEIFPKQDKPGRRGLSSLVKLPLGLHQATLRRCMLLDESLEPIADVRAALARLRSADRARIDAILGRRIVALPLATAASEPAPALPKQESPRSLARALREIGGGREARLAAERMIEGCGVLRALVDRAYGPERLTPDQARALIYSVGLVGESPELAIEILAAAQMPMQELHRVRHGLPSPVGCRRLVALQCGTCESCPRGPSAQPYPTPAYLAVGTVEPAPPRAAPFARWLEPADHLAPDALETLAEKIDHLERRVRRLDPNDDPNDDDGP